MSIKHLIPVGLCLCLGGSAADWSLLTTRSLSLHGSSAPGAAAPGALSDMWLVPDTAGSESAPVVRLGRGVQLYHDGRFAQALPLVTTQGLAGTPLADYARYYQGLVQLEMKRLSDARATFRELVAAAPPGYLSEAAMLAEADAAAAQGDRRAALALYARLRVERVARPDEVLSRIVRVALEAGDDTRARAALEHLYYGYPLSALSANAGPKIEAFRKADPGEPGGLGREIARAQLLYDSRQYRQAKAEFTSLQSRAEGGEADLIDLRVGQCDYHLGQHRVAADRLKRHLDSGPRQDEARFYYLSAVRRLGRTSEYIERSRELAADFRTSSWAEEALNNLASYYIIDDEDEKADEVFRDMYARFPSGARTERAAWKIGWWAYRNGRPEEAATVFEEAAGRMPKADWRPAFLYWAGRARERLGATGIAADRYRLVLDEYRYSFYGLKADERLRGGREATRGTSGGRPEPDRAIASAASPGNAGQPAAAGQAVQPPTASLIRQLLAAGLYEDALNELRYAQRTWGDTSALQATVAWLLYRRGDLLGATVQMKRAYPQYLSTARQMPVEILQVIFPLDYWDAIRRHAAASKLDPYLVAALIKQESAYAPKVRSTANAYGLMQILPSTGRRIARTVSIRRFTTSSLTVPDTNIRIGTVYFSRLIEQFGAVHLALASYNAGESRVNRWLGERRGEKLDEDEFIDDIPFPETQNYVKKILGWAELYRYVYGEMGAAPTAGRPAAAH